MCPPTPHCRWKKLLQSTQYLMPSTLPVRPISDSDDVGCVRCSKCMICKIHMVESKTFKSSVTGETFTVRHKFSCGSQNIIYLLFCQKACANSQYIGQTKNKLRTRLYTHRSDININRGNKVTLVTQHFNSHNHTLDDMRCMVIEKVYNQSQEARNRRESFWISKMKTLTPYGLNTMDA